MVKLKHWRRVLPALLVIPALASGAEGTLGLHAHMDDDPVRAMVLLDRFEWQDADAGSALAWNLQAWVGTDKHRLLLRAEGDRVAGNTEENRLELLWSQPLNSRWDLVAGLRQDLEPASARSYAAFGVQGLAPGWVHLEGTAYLGERGQTAATLEATTDVLLTNRLLLTPRLEVQAYGRDDETNGIGSGLAEIAVGLRLRYEIRREFAPYVGAEWTRKTGDTAGFARQAGETVRSARWVAGVRAWF
ncbi:MAG: copper resistance protein B [Gammaproteobacteria bacterium]